MRCRDLCAGYGKEVNGVVALSGLSLDIAEGEFVSLVGPSGCGKTTLLRMLAGLVPLRSGVLERGGGTDGGGVGLVLQENSLFPWMTVIENAAFALEMQGVPQGSREALARPMLEQFGLAGRDRAYPNQLSAGMKQRVAVACAFLSKATLLLMDEPFGALDAMTRQRLQQELLREWTSSRRTVLFVTHDVDEAILLGERVLVMTPQPGRIEAQFDVPFGYPRGLSLASATPFLEIKRKIYELLGVIEEDRKPAAN